MVEINFKNLRAAEAALKRALNKEQSRIIKEIEEYLVRQNELLGDRFAQSKEFSDLKTSLKGEFGFTDKDILDINNIIDVIKNDQSVTRIKASRDSVILEWVDFKALINTEEAKHKLTKYNSETKTFEVTQIVSWLDWLENGLTITGYVFEKGGGKFSRSGDGRMMESNGLFKLPQTKVLEKIAKKVTPTSISRGAAAIIKRRT